MENFQDLLDKLAEENHKCMKTRNVKHFWETLLLDLRIGTKVRYNNVILKVVKVHNSLKQCEECYFNGSFRCSKIACEASKRKSNTSIIFKKIEI